MDLSLDGHRDWQVAVLNGGQVTQDQYEQRFTDAFRAAVSFADVAAIGSQLGPLGPWRVLREVERRGDGVLAVQLASGSGEQLRLTLLRSEDGRIEASTILVTTPCAPAVSPDAELAAPLSAQLGWVRDRFLEASVELGEQELEEHLAPVFLQQVPVADLHEAREGIVALGPFSLRHYEGDPRPTALAARLGVRTGEEARLVLTIEPDAPHRLIELSIFTQHPCRLD